MLSNTIRNNLELFDSLPFYVCITDKKGNISWSNLLFETDVIKVYGSQKTIFDAVELICNSIMLAKRIQEKLRFSSDLNEVVSLLNEESIIKENLQIQQTDNQELVFFFRFAVHSKRCLNNLFSTAFIHEASDTIISYTLSGEIVVWNLAAEKLFGLKRNDVIGSKIVKLPFSSFTKEKITQEVIELQKTKELKCSEEEIAVNGENRFFKITSQLILGGNNEILGISKCFSDITSFVTAEKLLQKHVENLQYLNNIWESLSQNLDVQNILQIVTDVTTKFSGASYGAFFYNSLTEDGEAMRLFTLSGAKREDFMKLGMPRNTDIFKKTFNSKEAFIANDITQHEDFGKNTPHNGLPKGHLAVRSYMSIPVISMSGENLGSLLFGHSMPGRFSQEHIKMMQSIASQAAIALENSRLLENVKTLSNKKDLFITVVGHELRSPLTTIKGFMQVLEEVNQDEELRLYIDKVLEQIDKLNFLVNDLLDIGQIGAGKMTLEKSEFCLSELVKDTIETVSYAQNTHDIIFENAQSMLISADKRRIQQVLYNLISNAVKYSPDADKVVVQAKTENSEVIVKVIDSGIGISEQHIHNIFDRFYRIPTQKNISGIGIGLFLCSKIIKKHGGTLSVNSIMNQGSEFVFKIPIGVCWA
ncbi:ATP-binding protein [Flavobacterium sp. U410]